MKMLSTKNVISIDDLSIDDIYMIMENADSFYEVLDRELKKVPTLRGKTIINLFFESSTRTRTSFEIAAKRLSADLINFSASTSSLKKGESIIDTLKTIQSMMIDLLIVRHSDSGVMNFIADNIDVPIINAGDGKHQHPTQALLDLYTIKKSFKDFKGLKVAVTGDILNSRVARSDIKLFKRMGMDVTIVSASMLLPENIECFDSNCVYDLDKVIEDIDILYMLRMQFERQDRKYYPSIKEYNRFLSLNMKRLKRMKSGSIVMHPGPVNRGIEVSEDVMNHAEKYSGFKINTQVTNGVAVRMALIYLMLGST
jgi:aspartate carbamoyltransferase catalytic subunit